MGLSTESGSLNTTLSPTDNENVVNVVTETPTVEEHLDRQSFVTDSTHNQTALTEVRDQDIIDCLIGYQSGAPFIVTYFHKMDSRAVNQSGLGDLSFGEDSVHHSLLRINNFEFRLKAALDFSYDANNPASTWNGTAAVLPGFEPKVGDLFIYEIEPSKLALFIIRSSPRRLSIKVNTSHEVDFEIVKILTGDDTASILERVRDEAYFNKQRFLSEDTALLKKEEVIEIQYIDQKYNELVTYFVDTFHDKLTYSSFIRPDDCYDPYIVEFIKQTVDLSNQNVWVENLLPKHDNHRKTVWNKILLPKSLDWSNVYGSTYGTLLELTPVQYRVSSLLNRVYLTVTPTPDPEYDDNLDLIPPTTEEGYPTTPYISANIGNLDISTYTSFDKLLMIYLEYELIDINHLKDVIATIYDESDINQFYYLPIILFLMNRVKYGIQTGNNIELLEKTDDVYRDIEFTDTDDNLVANVLTIEGIDIDIVGVLDDNGDYVDISEADITDVPTGVELSLVAALGLMGLTEVTGTWKVVIKNNSLKGI